ncbi:hypothetical protein V9T40_008392 [Parthenolecanium corni]|uniref:Uncharacterized protein n=1 Tax=Parthenolecanium corni TaxID=536013 RepID=A0AAN9Y6J0_9HEMI
MPTAAPSHFPPRQFINTPRIPPPPRSHHRRYTLGRSSIRRNPSALRRQSSASADSRRLPPSARLFEDESGPSISYSWATGFGLRASGFGLLDSLAFRSRLDCSSSAAAAGESVLLLLLRRYSTVVDRDGAGAGAGAGAERKRALLFRPTFCVRFRIRCSL